MWASLVVSIAKAIPAFRDIYEDSIALYYANDQRADQAAQVEIQEERDAILSAIKQPGLTDEAKRTFRKRLIALSKL